jgi:hypothetical protein
VRNVRKNKTFKLLIIVLLGISIIPIATRPIRAQVNSTSTTTSDPIVVYVGYADDARPNAFFPTPWCSSPKVIFVGACSGIDAGVVRIDNTGSSNVTISSVNVLLPGPTPSMFYCCRPITISYWPGYGGATGSVTIPPGWTLILSQTAGEFGIQDTSDYNFNSCGNPATIGVEFPVVFVTTGGGTQEWDDKGHTIDTEGFDLACKVNESLQWRPAAPPFFEGNPELELTPFNATNMVGTSHTLFATLISNVTLAPISNTTVTLTITGANTLTGSCISDASGKCNFTYTGTNSGVDTIVGSATVGGVLVKAPPVEKFWTAPPLKVAKFFTDSSLNPLPLDNNGNPSINVVLASGNVRSTNPGQVLAWVNVTNTGSQPLQSLKLNETLPVDWSVNPAWMPGTGGIHVYFANTTSLGTNPDITQVSTVTVRTGNPQTVQLAIPNLNATLIGHPLMPGQSLLLSVKLSYALKGTSQTFKSYPRNYTDTASAVAWAQASFTGAEATGTGSAFFVAYATVLGDVNGDGNVDIVDISMLEYAYGSHPGDARWLPSGDFYTRGVIDMTDISTALYYYGTSS